MLSRRLGKVYKLLQLVPFPQFRRGLREGVSAAVEHHRILAPLAAQTVIDIGANVGQFALLSRQLYPSARIFSFEPLLEAASRFRRLFRSDSQVTLYPFAIGPKSEVREMHVSKRADSSSLLPITEAQKRFAPGTEEVGRETVTVKNLDEVLPADSLKDPVLLKLDVQGFELEALRGCRALLHAVTFVYVEVSFVELYAGQAHADDVVRFLFEQGFSLAGVNQPSYDRMGRCVQTDMLFRRIAR